MNTHQLTARLLPFLLVACAAPSIDVTPVFGSFKVDGSLGVSSTGTPIGSDLRQAGLGQDEGGGGGRADLKMGVPHLTIATHLSRHQGSGTTQFALTDGAVAIPAGASVNTDLNIGVHEGILTFDVIPGDFELGLGFGLAGIELDADFTRIVNGNTVATDQVLPIPIFAVRAAIPLGDFELEALLAGNDMAWDGDDLRFSDLDLRGRWRFVGGEDRLRVSLLLGYRRVNFDLEYSEDLERIDADLELSGPYFGVALSL